MMFLSLFIMSGIVVYCAVHPPQQTLPQPVDTQPIGPDQPTGGVANNQAEPRTPSTSSSPKSSARPKTGTTAPAKADYTAAPKQAEIEQSITQEYEYHALATPNDPYYTSQTYRPWALQHTGAPAVWNQTTGSPVVVAVVDTGYALQHEDLNTQWYTSPGETGMTASGDKCWTGAAQDKSTNKCDDDGNGYVDDWRGWNFYGKYQPTNDPCSVDGLGTYVANNNPQAGSSGDDILYAEDTQCFGTDPGDPFEAVSHGTSTAGLAGAATNNGRGIASFNWNAKIMPLQALGDDGSGWTGKIVAAIRYATDNGAHIISLSLGSSDRDSALEAAINYAYSKNVIVVAAAGNCGSGTEGGCDPSRPGEMGYPALYNHVISVGATDANDARANFSSYGPGLDIVAPGSGTIVSALVSRGATPGDPQTFNYTNGYSSTLYGTSFSTPLVSSVISLVKSVKPSYTVDDVTALVDATAIKPAGMNGKFYTNEYGHGIINADAIATVARSLAASSPTPTLLQTGGYRSEHSVTNNEPLSSGCRTLANTYCTIRTTSELNGYDRYLPYKLTDGAGSTGWSWSSDSLAGETTWFTSAVQGASRDGYYLLFRK